MIHNNRDKPWILDGIKSVTVIPNVKRYGLNAVLYSVGGEGIRTVNSFKLDPLQRPQARRFDLFPDWRNAIKPFIPPRYRNLDKLFTSQYMMIEATVWGGSSLAIRPENWGSDNATMTERVSLLPPGQRIVLAPFKYNSAQEAYVDADGDDWGEHIGMSLSIDQFPTIPVLNDSATLAIANNARGLAFQRQNADWSQTRAQQGISTSYDQASNAMSTATQQTDLSNRASAESTRINNQFAASSALMQGGASIATGAVAGGVGGAVVGGVGAIPGAAIGAATAAAGVGANLLGTSMQIAQSQQQNALATSTASAATGLANQSAAFVRDTNRDLAQFTARGDYAQAIAGINARVQDTMMTPPSVLGNAGGETFRVINNMMEVNLRWKMVDEAALARVGEYWFRYGYAVNRYANVPDSLMTHDRFTYWKLSETYIKSANMPEAYKHAIRGIFEKGVTVWNNPEDIGNIDWANNNALEGISL